MNNQSKLTKNLAISGLLIALGVILSGFYIPFGASKCFPIQHFINVVGAVILGPFYSVCIAFCISVIRVMSGTGSLLAFPGSMIGALLAGLAMKYFKHYRYACLGEVLGTGLIGGLIAAPYGMLLMGLNKGAFFFVGPFILSTLVGSAIAWVLLESTDLLFLLKKKYKVNS